MQLYKCRPWRPTGHASGLPYAEVTEVSCLRGQVIRRAVHKPQRSYSPDSKNRDRVRDSMAETKVGLQLISVLALIAL